MRRRGSARIPELSSARNVIKRFWKHFQTDTFHARGCHDHRTECAVRKKNKNMRRLCRCDKVWNSTEICLNSFLSTEYSADDKGIYRRSELSGNEVWEGSVNTVSVSASQQQQIFCDLLHSLVWIATECPDLIYLARIQSKPLQESQLWRFHTDISDTTAKNPNIQM